MHLISKIILRAAAAVLLSGSLAGQSVAQEGKPAKELFGGMKLPSRSDAQSFGFYSKGCMAGGVAIPTDGPTWQAMRLSRNRRWGHPQMIALIEQFSRDATEKAGWPGLLLGDISQPRGGPMLTGHASHQIGLDADIWLTPMPQRKLSYREREDTSAISMLAKNKFLTVDPSIWTPQHARLIMLAASYPQVERVFVNPAIKKKLCDTWTGDRSALGKVRPIYGHDYHFHIRINCPADAVGCKAQAPVPEGDGCDKSLAWWFTDEPWAKPKPDPNKKPVKPRPVVLSDLPKACAVVLAEPARPEEEATFGTDAVAFSSEQPPSAPVQSIEAIIGGEPAALANVPVPLPRPMR